MVFPRPLCRFGRLRQELGTLDRARQLAGNLLDSVLLQLKIETNGNRWIGNTSKVRTIGGRSSH